jgi:diguanylate cyclase (GGDEF)-like protein/PAS domain S-box-containing protein
MHAPSVAPSFTTTSTGRILAHDELLPALLADSDLVGRQLEAFGRTPADVESIRACLRSVAADGVAERVQVQLRSTDERDVNVHLVVAPCPDGHLAVVLIDETSRIDAEEELARSERRWLALLRNSADIVFTTAPDGTLTSVTSALAERLGWSADDVIGSAGLDFVHPDDRQVARQVWEDVSAGHISQVSLEIRLIRVNRTPLWARVVISDLRDDPDVRSVIGNVTDITEHKSEETRRHLEEARFRARFDQSRLPQILQDKDGVYQAVNDAFCVMLGRPREELVGLTATAITHPDDPGEAEAVLGQLRRGEMDWAQVDRLLADADGHPVPVRIDVTLLRDADGDPDGCAASLQDLRPLRNSERARFHLQNIFDVVAERSRDFIILYDADGNNVYASPSGLAMFGEGYNKSSDDMWQLVHPDDLEQTRREWISIQSQKESRSWRYRARNADGRWIWIEQTSTNLLDTNAAVVVAALRDVTQHVEAAEALRISEARYRAIAETAEEGILVTAPDGTVSYANARLTSMLGLSPNLHRVPAASALTGLVTFDVAARIRDRPRRGAERYEVPYLHPDGSTRMLWIAASPMPDVDGTPQGSLAMVSDITELRRNERDLRHAAEHDELTGLLNRTMLLDHLGEPVAEGTAVLFIDLDHFKDVNDGRGHGAGDDVLIEVASRLRAAVSPGEVVGRFGGDEFVVVLHDVDADAAQATARRLLDVVSTPYEIGHHSVRIGATIGVALSPASSAEDLLRFADIAMYAAKATSRGHVRLFDTALTEQAEERYQLGVELLKALETDGLEMQYQPVVDISTGEASGVEALARWHHPTRGTIAPERFVAIAEMNASAVDLDRWVLRRTMNDIAELKAVWVMPEAATVSINLSGQSLTDGLDTFIVDVTESAGLDPGTIILEITESAIMADKDIAISVLQRLRDQGFGIAIDDFGTGYSSMAYLRDLPITMLKIDRGFVRGIPDDAHSLAIVTSLIELARSLDLTVVAEGVETLAQLGALRARGCSFAQGWLWSKAVTPAEIQHADVFRHLSDTGSRWPDQ